VGRGYPPVADRYDPTAAMEAVMRKYAYAWLTLGFFLVSFLLHWWFGWLAFVDEQRQHSQTADVGEYLTLMGRDTFENWQSEFLQLLWQVVGLAYFLYVGSPSSKENDDRVELKIDALLKQAGLEDLQERIDQTHFRHAGHAKPHPH
jgi:cbb3-type cytochrome oxidase subunit 3